MVFESGSRGARHSVFQRTVRSATATLTCDYRPLRQERSCSYKLKCAISMNLQCARGFSMPTNASYCQGAESSQTVAFVAQIAARTPISIGCFCRDETRCHRSRLFKVVQKRAPAE
jgi:hypothetical protein